MISDNTIPLQLHARAWPQEQIQRFQLASEQAPRTQLLSRPWEPAHETLPREKGKLAEQSRDLKSKKGYSLTRFGCRTCKIRRIRCDEGRPTCQNCIKAHRQCKRPAQHGDNVAGTVSFAAPLTLSHFQPSRSRGLRHDEVAYLDRFRHRLINGIVGDSSRESWKQLILQAVHEQPALCHVAIAFSALHGLPEGSEPRWITDGDGGDEQAAASSRRVALKHYNQCIKHLQDVVVRNDATSTNTTLLCTLLCICFEIRIRNPFMALSHLEHSLRILDTKAATVDDDLVLAFTRLDVQAAVCLGRRAPSLKNDRFSNIQMGKGVGHQEADKELTALLGRIFTFIRGRADPLRYYSIQKSVPDDVLAEAGSLQEEMQRFQEKYLTKELPTSSSVESMASEDCVLWMKYLSTVVLLGPSADLEERAYDDFLAEFTSILALASRVEQPCRDGLHWRNEFSLNMALIHPLFKVAQKCRNPSVRRRAIDLLGDVPGPEGPWDAPAYKVYAERMVQLEEDGVELDMSRLDEMEARMIPEGNRIHFIEIWPAGERTSAVTFRQRPNGVGTDWFDTTEMIFW